jgi:hypothetical protein
MVMSEKLTTSIKRMEKLYNLLYTERDALQKKKPTPKHLARIAELDQLEMRLDTLLDEMRQIIDK